MLSKLIRPEYYDEDYYLNEQEYKEFNFVRVDPYWKTRSSCYALGLNCFGDKEMLSKRIDLLLYNNYLHKKPSIENCKDLAATDIEVVVKNLKCTSSQFDTVNIKDLESYLLSNIETKVPVETIFNHQWPWQVVVELSKMNRSLSYQEIYHGITYLMRSTMVFYNHFLENETLTAIVAFPYTPKMLDYLSPLQIYHIVRALEMKLNYDVPNIMDILKQKLYDMFYLVEDNQRLHGIIPCQTQFKCCNNLASQMCANHMCKICCQDAQNKLPCIIHDRYEQFFICKTRSLYSFEESKNFDRLRTIRIHFRKLIRKYDLEKTFEGLEIEWDQLQTYFHHSAYKLQYVYLVCSTKEVAKKIIEDKHIYTLRLEKYDANIETLNTSLFKICEKYDQVENMLVIIKPQSTLEIVQELPINTTEYTDKVNHLIQSITQLSPEEYTLEEDTNPITDEKDQTHIFVKLPSKANVDKVYNSQPYFGCLIAHKLSHIQLCPFLRYGPDMCLMCTSKKEAECIHDMCKECCSRQKYGIIPCKCATLIVRSNSIDKTDDMDTENSLSDPICEKCSNKQDANCVNKMCSTCCRIQAIRLECSLHDQSYYCNEMKSLEDHKTKHTHPYYAHMHNAYDAIYYARPAYLLSRKMLKIVSECHIKVRFELKHGRYDWFRPVYGTNIQIEMIKANKELQVVIDNGNVIRGPGTSKSRKDGKIFTFQGNEPITIWITNQEKIYESIDKKGQPYIEYGLDEQINKEEPCVWIKNSPNNFRYTQVLQRTYSSDDYEQYIHASNLQIRTNFHLMFVGLDKITFTVRELYQEILSKINNLVGNLEMKNIMVLDNESLLTDIFNTPIFKTSKNLEDNVRKLGRVACVKFDNMLDALALLTGEIKITLPLNNGTTNSPLIFPSRHLLKLIEEYTSQTPINFNTAGHMFTGLNREIEVIQNGIKNLTNSNEKKSPYSRKSKFVTTKKSHSSQYSQGPKLYKKFKPNPR